MDIKRVKVFAPASIANLGPGFDVLGIAIERVGDVIVAEKTVQPGLKFSVQNQDSNVPTDNKNVAAHVANLMLAEFKPTFGLSLCLQKNIPLGSGLGSSGASSVAAAFAVNALLPAPLAKKELIRYAAEGERLASGSPHADNVAPSMLGGLCLIRSYQPLDVISIPTKNIFHWVVAHPHMVIETQTARKLLPQMISLSSAVQEWGNVAGLVTGLILGDREVVRKSLDDVIVEPLRSALIPHYAEVKQAALKAGAIAFSISGSGPSVFALAASEEEGKVIATAIEQAFKQLSNMQCDIFISRINEEGATILEQSP